MYVYVSLSQKFGTTDWTAITSALYTSWNNTKRALKNSNSRAQNLFVFEMLYHEVCVMMCPSVFYSSVKIVDENMQNVKNVCLIRLLINNQIDTEDQPYAPSPATKPIIN